MKRTKLVALMVLVCLLTVIAGGIPGMAEAATTPAVGTVGALSIANSVKVVSDIANSDGFMLKAVSNNQVVNTPFDFARQVVTGKRIGLYAETGSETQIYEAVAKDGAILLRVKNTEVYIGKDSKNNLITTSENNAVKIAVTVVDATKNTVKVFIEGTDYCITVVDNKNVKFAKKTNGDKQVFIVKAYKDKSEVLPNKFVFYSQKDSSFGGYNLVNQKMMNQKTYLNNYNLPTIWAVGCLVTSECNGLVNQGVLAKMNPKEYAQKYLVFNDDGGISSGKYHNRYVRATFINNNQDLATVKNLIATGHYPIIGGKTGKNTHFVCVVGYINSGLKPEDFIIADPAYMSMRDGEKHRTLKNFLDKYNTSNTMRVYF